MHDPNYSLFDEEAFKDIPISKSAGLAIRKGSRKKLSKAQNDFNRLTKRIVELQKQLDERRVLYEQILAKWSEHMPELDAAFAVRQLRTALQLDKAGLRFTYGSVQTLKLRFTIITLLREAFSSIDPTPEGEEVFHRWYGKKLQSVVQEEFEEAKSVMSEGLRESFGEDFDLSNLDMSVESFARFSAELEAKLAAAERDDYRHAGSTAREMQAELRAKLEAERIQRSIRGVYLNIAKALHPDTTLDEDERLRHDDVMKTVTVAYENNDLQTLLHIEMTEMQRGAERINYLPDETLALYNASLKEQAEVLQAELNELRHNPRYMPISSIVGLNPTFADGRLQREISKTKQLIERFEHTLTVLSDEAPKQDVMSVLDNFCEDYEVEFAMWSGRPLKRPVYSFGSYRDSRF